MDRDSSNFIVGFLFGVLFMTFVSMFSKYIKTNDQIHSLMVDVNKIINRVQKINSLNDSH